MACTTHQPAIAILAATALLLSVVAGATAQEPTGAGTPTPSSSATAASSQLADVPHPSPTLADFAWLAGEWHGTWGPRVAVEAWTPPHAGVMLGSFQRSENGKTLVL